MNKEVYTPIEFLTKAPNNIMTDELFWNKENRFFLNNYGEGYEIISVNNAYDIVVKMLSSGYIFHASLQAIRHGDVGCYTELISDEAAAKQVGKVYYNQQGDLFKIIGYTETQFIVQFLDRFKSIAYMPKRIKHKGANNKLAVRNPYHVLEDYDVYVGDKYNRNDSNLMHHIYNVWYSIVYRTYHGYDLDIPSVKPYKNVLLGYQWRFFDNFVDWYLQELEEVDRKFEFVLEVDKDILQIGEHPKIYGPFNCMLVPKEINILVNGIYNKRTNDGLPLGVLYRKELGKYYSDYSVTMNGKYTRVFAQLFDNPMEAFEAYREVRVKYFKDVATKCYNEGSLSKRNYDYIMDSFDLLPYDN